ncbi:MAG: endo-1,4-beta-xylanase, partial [Phycisphaeraceae bacterium]|nr:endo-1,4-beta-xylanase [Phycisphaeraceae bacterium]
VSKYGKNNPFGAMVQPHGGYPLFAVEKDAMLMKRIGMAWVRTHKVNWQNVQKGPDVALDWKEADNNVNLYEKHGLNIVATTCWPTPKWASDGKGSGLDRRSQSIMMPKKEYMPAMAKFCREMAARYKGKIANYEIGNEVDAKNFWMGSLKSHLQGNEKGIMKDYCDLFLLAAKEISKEDPIAKIAPSTTGTAPEGNFYKPWLKTMYELGIGKRMTAFSTHYSGDIDAIQKVMDKYDGRVDIIFTEIGGMVWGKESADTPQNMKRMIKRTTQQYTIQLSKGAKVLCKFLLRDLPNNALPHICGLLYPDFRVRSNYVAHATMIRNLVGAEFKKELNITYASETGWLQGFCFKKDGKDVNVLWLNDAKSSKATFETTSQEIDLVDVMGNVKHLLVSQNKFDVTFEKDMPVYIIGKIKDKDGEIKYPQDQLVKTIDLKLNNADFESKGSALNKVPNWPIMINEKKLGGKKGPQFNVFVDRKTKSHGQKSLSFKADSPTLWWGATQKLDLSKIPTLNEGEYLIFEVTYSLKGKKISGIGASICLAFRKSNGERIFFQGGDYKGGTFDWREITKKMKPIAKIPAGTKKITLDLILGKSTGQVWYDNINVKAHLWKKDIVSKNSK